MRPFHRPSISRSSPFLLFCWFYFLRFLLPFVVAVFGVGPQAGKIWDIWKCITMIIRGTSTREMGKDFPGQWRDMDYEPSQQLRHSVSQRNNGRRIGTKRRVINVPSTFYGRRFCQNGADLDRERRKNEDLLATFRATWTFYSLVPHFVPNLIANLVVACRNSIYFFGTACILGLSGERGAQFASDLWVNQVHNRKRKEGYTTGKGGGIFIFVPLEFLALILSRCKQGNRELTLQLAFKCLDKIVNFSSHELSPRKLCRQTGKTARDANSEIFALAEMSPPSRTTI